jgi:hypothetical protein
MSVKDNSLAVAGFIADAIDTGNLDMPHGHAAQVSAIQSAANVLGLTVDVDLTETFVGEIMALTGIAGLSEADAEQVVAMVDGDPAMVAGLIDEIAGVDLGEDGEISEY